MSVFLIILFWIFIVAGLVYWTAGAILTRVVSRGVRIGPGDPGAGADAPPVLVLVPARDEERAIETCLRSLLDQDHRRLHILLADDGSTDRTREIADRIAAEDRRLEIVSPGEPPPGWVGKCWALHRAYEEGRARGRADGSLLLFADADVRFHPRTVSIAVRRLLDERLDLLALLPRISNQTFWEKTIQPAVIHALLILGGLSQLFPTRNFPRMASGAFLLVRSEAYRAAGGHLALRREIVEDVALATTVHQRGGRTGSRMAPDLVRLRMYHGIGEIWRGWTKNSFAGTDDRLRRALQVVVILLGFWVVPGLLFPVLLGRSVLTGTGWAATVGIGLLWGVMTAARMAGNRLTGDPPAYAILQPVAGAFMAVVLAVSTWSRRFGRGALWRGRRYPLHRADPDIPASG
jgi:chlorobactene glucosyltransferase